MIIGTRLRTLRQAKNLSQGDIEKRSGLLRCYLSRVEHGHTIPSIETLEKWARALDVPLYRLFYEGDKPPGLPNLAKRKTADEIAVASPTEERRFWLKFRGLLRRINEADRRLLLQVAQRMAKR